MQTAGVTLLLATAIIGFAQQNDAPTIQKIRTSTGLELEVVLPAVNGPFRVYFAYAPGGAGEYPQPARNVALLNPGTPEIAPPVIASPGVVIAGDPKIMFDTAVHDEQSGRLDRAKLTLLTLASKYSDSPLAAKAKVEIGAIYIFEEAQVQARSGQSRAAYDSFKVVSLVYPESALARFALTEMGKLDPKRK